MDVDPDEILRYIQDGTLEGETVKYWESMRKLPRFDHAHYYEKLATNKYPETIFQGDTLYKLPYTSVTSPKLIDSFCIVISSTCDIDLANKHLFPSRILYAPVLKLSAYRKRLLAGHDPADPDKFNEASVDQFLEDIRLNKIGQAFYLPKGGDLDEEAFVFLDTIVSNSNASIDRATLNSMRKTSMSLYGWHLFQVKLNVFFTRRTTQTVELRLKTAS